MRHKEVILDAQHWKFDDYRQRIKAKDWKQLLLNNDDHIVFRGKMVNLVGKNLGCGVYEVSKQITSASTEP